MHRRIPSVALIAVTALAALGSQLANPGVVAAAVTDQLRETGRTTYELLPARHVVHVTMSLTLTNKAPSSTRSHKCTQYYIDPYYGYVPYTTTCTARTDYYYNSYSPWVEKDAVNLKVKADSGSASVKLGKRTGEYRKAVIKFSNLNYGRTRRLTLTYDLRGGGPRSTLARRTGSGYANFCVSGPGTDVGSVRAVVPSGFVLSVTRAMRSVTASGHTTYSTPTTTKPWTFYACFTGSNEIGGATTTVPGTDGRSITIQSWKDDPEWATAVDTAVRNDLPKLVELLGPLSLDRPLTIHERAGLTGVDAYSSTTGILQISEQTKTEDVALHRIAQLWFDERLFLSRWMRDGYADWAVRASGSGTPACDEPGPFPGAGGPNLASAHDLPASPSAQDLAVRAWDRQAGCYVIASVAAAIGPARMMETLGTLRGAGSAFSPIAGAGARASPRTWQEWLDVIEQQGLLPAGADPDLAAHLAATYGVTADTNILAVHRAAITTYTTLHDRIGTTPTPVRDARDAWVFDRATAAMTAASQAWDAADSTVGAIPAIDDVAMPVRDAVRGAATQGDLDAARSLGVKQQALATEVSAALATKTAPRDVIQEFGLLGTTLPLDSAAIDAVARIDSEGATVMTDQIRSLIAGARDTGTQRLATILGAVIALGLLLLLGAVVLRRRRRRRRSPGTGPPLVVDLPTEP
jgi:hypothetical protein